MKLVFFTIIFTISNPVFSSQKILGEYTTVSEYECNSEIHFYKNGKGVFIDSCRREDGSYIGDIYKDDISWNINNDRLLVKINGISETFTYHSNLSCISFGEDGGSNGLVGFDHYFWRKPVKCR
jgi:hypothetical protein